MLCLAKGMQLSWNAGRLEACKYVLEAIRKRQVAQCCNTKPIFISGAKGSWVSGSLDYKSTVQTARPQHFLIIPIIIIQAY